MTSLNRTWTLYFHAKDKSKNYDTNTIKVMDISTVEDFWGCFNHTPKPYELFYDGYTQKASKITDRSRGETEGTLYIPNAWSFFEQGVNPTWDDPSNIDGAEWSIRKFNGLKDISGMWMTALLDLVGEMSDYSHHIKGIRIVDSTLPEKPMYRLEVWFDKAEVSDIIQTHIKKLFNIKNNLLYRVHKNVKEI